MSYLKQVKDFSFKFPQKKNNSRKTAADLIQVTWLPSSQSITSSAGSTKSNLHSKQQLQIFKQLQPTWLLIEVGLCILLYRVVADGSNQKPLRAWKLSKQASFAVSAERCKS